MRLLLFLPYREFIPTVWKDWREDLANLFSAIEGFPSGPVRMPLGVPFMIPSTSSKSRRILHFEKSAVDLSRDSLPTSGLVLSVLYRCSATFCASVPSVLGPKYTF